MKYQRRFLKSTLPTSVFFVAFLALLPSFFLTGCANDTVVPVDTNNICHLFAEHPSWYWESLAAYKKWGVPVSVQMAIVHRESSFQKYARPPRSKLLGVIPWSYQSSAYGYSQALNGTWAQYTQETKRPEAHRDSFPDALDFLGWYANRIHNKLGISKKDPYRLYLAYHEGINGYAANSFSGQPWLIDVAKDVQYKASLYRKQLLSCYKTIPKPSAWNLWLK